MPGKKRPTVKGAMSQLDALVHQAGLHLKPQMEGKPQPDPFVVSPERTIPDDAREPTDEEAFAEAMAGVNRAEWKHHVHPSSRVVRPAASDPEAEARRLMQQALDEDTPIAIPDHPEYIEGWVGVAGKRLLPKLRNGMYSIQGQIDLHGLNRLEARHAVEDYLIRMSRFRPCCVKIIHGRGINSSADKATLKESLQRLLSTRKMSRCVVAYASAASRDGGVGAVYVLLSRQ